MLVPAVTVYTTMKIFGHQALMRQGTQRITPNIQPLISTTFESKAKIYVRIGVHRLFSGHTPPARPRLECIVSMMSRVAIGLWPNGRTCSVPRFSSLGTLTQRRHPGQHLFSAARRSVTNHEQTENSRNHTMTFTKIPPALQLNAEVHIKWMSQRGPHARSVCTTANHCYQ